MGGDADYLHPACFRSPMEAELTRQGLVNVRGGRPPAGLRMKAHVQNVLDYRGLGRRSGYSEQASAAPRNERE